MKEQFAKAEKRSCEEFAARTASQQFCWIEIFNLSLGTIFLCRMTEGKRYESQFQEQEHLKPQKSKPPTTQQRFQVNGRRGNSLLIRARKNLRVPPGELVVCAHQRLNHSFGYFFRDSIQRRIDNDPFVDLLSRVYQISGVA